MRPSKGEHRDWSAVPASQRTTEIDGTCEHINLLCCNPLYLWSFVTAMSLGNFKIRTSCIENFTHTSFYENRILFQLTRTFGQIRISKSKAGS